MPLGIKIEYTHIQSAKYFNNYDKRRYMNFLLLTLKISLVITLISIPSCEYESDVSYWVWRTTDMNIVSPNDSLILYQGNFSDRSEFTYKGIRPSNIQQNRVTLLIRLYTLPPAGDILSLYNYLKRDWNSYGVNIIGLEVDYDSPSMKLEIYAKWLKELRVLMKNPLSATSLSTYVHDNPKGLKSVSKNVDHISMQLYKGFNPHSAYLHVISWLNKSKINHKIGVTLSTKFQNSKSLCLEYCKGINIFLNRKDSK